MSDGAQDREALLAEVGRLRRQLSELESAHDARQRAAMRRLHDRVWRMERAADMRAVAVSLEEALRDLGVRFDAFGVNVAEETVDGVRFQDYTARKSGRELAPLQSATLAAFWRGGVPVYRPDLERDDPYHEREFLARWSVRAVLDVPFSQGTVAVSSRQPDAFTPRDMESIQQLADVLSEGFRRMADFRVLEDRNADLEAEVAGRRQLELQSQARTRVRERVWQMRRVDDIVRVLEAVGESLRAMGVPFMYCGVNLVDTEARASTSTYTLSQDGTWRHVEFSGDQLLARFWTEQRPVYRRDLWTEDPYGERERLPRLRAVLDVPFSQGTLAVSSREPGAFDDDDVRVLSDMAGLLSEGFARMGDLQTLEVRNRELEREVAERRRRELRQQARLRVRERLWRMAGAADIEGVLEEVGQALRHLGVPFRYCGVNVVDPGQLSAPAVYSMNQQGQWTRRKAAGTATITELWQRGAPTYRRDLRREDPFGEAARFPTIRSIVDVPFSHGTLAVSSEVPEAFDEADLEVLGEMAAILAEGFRRVEDLGALEERNRALEEEIAERRRAEEQLNASLREKVVLLKEIHHRVKNNLQVVSSLLSLQANGIEDPATRSSLDDSRSRIESMALVHEKLYESGNLGRIDFGDYLRTLASHVFDSSERVPQAVALEIEADSVPVPVDVAIPCGLIVNELVTNSLKYAFADRPQGKVRIELRSAGERRVILRVSDDGVGFPEGVDFRATGSLGMQLVVDLTAQLGGSIDLCRQGGTAFEIVFPLPEPRKE